MSIFGKNNKKKIALAVACASVLGGKTSAINNKAQNPQSAAAVGGAILVLITQSNKGLPRIKNWE